MPMKGFVIAALVSAAAVADGANPFRRADYEPLRSALLGRKDPRHPGRTAGFSARFVTLSKRWQDEVIHRHMLK